MRCCASRRHSHKTIDRSCSSLNCSLIDQRAAACTADITSGAALQLQCRSGPDLMVRFPLRNINSCTNQHALKLWPRRSLQSRLAPAAKHAVRNNTIVRHCLETRRKERWRDVQRRQEEEAVSGILHVRSFSYNLESLGRGCADGICSHE